MHHMLPSKLIPMCLCSAAMVLVLTGCLVRREVTSGGRTVEQKYVFKRPLKENAQ